MFFDTHAHINLHAFKEDAAEVMQRAFAAGVGVMNVGTELATSKQAVSMLKDYPDNVYAIVGLHPSHTYDNPFLDENESAFTVEREEFDYEEYKELAQNPRVVGIGECGLDYYRLDDANLRIASESANLSRPMRRDDYESDVNSDILGVSVIPSVVPPWRDGVEGSLHSANASVGMTVNEIKRLQREAFLDQVKLALELDKTLVIHCRPSKGSSDAYEDTIQILSTNIEILNKDSNTNIQILDNQEGEQSYKDFDTPTLNPSPLEGEGRERGKLRFEVHSFTGSLEVAQKFLELGGYIGLNGIITFGERKNKQPTSAGALAKAGDKTGNMAEVVKGVPLERIVLETDAPYLAPVPFRGKRNEPAYVVEVAKKIAELKGVSLEEVEKQTFENTKKLFNINLN